jgi:putative phosphoribosyl transferase
MDVTIPVGFLTLAGQLTVPRDAPGIVLFAHGSGSGRFSPRNRLVAEVFEEAGLGTLLIDLLTMEEEEVDRRTAEFRFNIPMLADRLVALVDWLREYEETRELPIGLFGSSTGAGAALIAAAERPDAVAAVVSRGGRPDLAGPHLPRVRAPTLLIVGGRDEPVIDLNLKAQQTLGARSRLKIIRGATHLFEEPGKLAEVARIARNWFLEHMKGGRSPATIRAEPGITERRRSPERTS